jgi:hypothetical protein
VSEGHEPAPAVGEETLSDRSEHEPGTTVTATRGPGEPIVVSASLYRRLTSNLFGFSMAMLSCLVVVGLVILITPRRNESAIPHVDYHSDLSGLVAIAPYQVQAPEGLPAQWYSTSTRLSGHAETPAGAGNFVDRMTSQGHPDGTSQIAGATWDRAFRPDKKQRSLIRRLPGLTLVITGTASYDELAVLAGSLRPQSKTSPAAPAATPT